MLILKKKRFRELNEFDIDRVLKENVQNLEEQNQTLLDFIASDQDVPSAVASDYATEAENNASEVLYLLAVTDHKEIVMDYFKDSPLFRKGRS